MSEVVPPKLLLDLARRGTRGEASPRRHQASRAIVLGRLENRRPIGLAFAIAALVGAGGGGAALLSNVHYSHYDRSGTSASTFARGSEAPPAPTIRMTEEAPSSDDLGVKIHVWPETATVFWDDKKLAGNPSSFRFEPDGKTHRVRAEAPGHAPKTQLVVMDAPYALFELELRPLPVSIGTVTASSSIINADPVVESLHEPFENCFIDALADDPSAPPGRTTVVLHIARNGKVESAAVEETEALNAATTTCLVAAAANSISFRTTDAGMVRVPVSFRK